MEKLQGLKFDGYKGTWHELERAKYHGDLFSCPSVLSDYDPAKSGHLAAKNVTNGDERKQRNPLCAGFTKSERKR